MGCVTSSKTIVQTAVRLDIEIFCVLVRDVKQFLRVAVHRAAVIDFKLYAEMTQTFAVENKVRRVAVLVNNALQCSSQQDAQ